MTKRFVHSFQVFEDLEDATRYCSLLDGEGKGCTGVAELDASDVSFHLVRTDKGLVPDETL